MNAGHKERLKKVVCRHCGTNIENGTRFCPRCGQNTGEAAEDVQAESATVDVSTPWRHDPEEQLEGHSLFYKILAALTGALLFIAVLLIVLAWSVSGGA